jgi:hypothetical protein
MKKALLDHLCATLFEMSMAMPDPRPRHRMVELAMGLLCGDSPKTISSAIEWHGAKGDWSAQYRVFSKSEWLPEDAFRPIIAGALRANPDGPAFGAMDDTLVRKTGRTIPGTAYARDKMSPPFHTNLVLGQRFLQTSLLVRANDECPWRAVPVAFRHVPPLKAPPRATEAEKKAVKEARKKHNLSTAGREELASLRTAIDHQPGGLERLLIMTGDGSFANRTFLEDPPDRTTVVVRIRKDARLRAELPVDDRVGPRKYGDHLPTPEQMLSAPDIRLQTLTVFVGGRLHHIKYKVVDRACWPKTTRDRPGMLVLLKPLGYRLRKGSKLLYRQPGYLFVTGARAKIADIIQAYLLRWEIEVNFRDEKTILGTGKAQVRNELSVARAPILLVAAYAALLLASISALDDRRNEQFDPLPPWRNDTIRRPSTRDLVRLLRKQINEVCKGRQAEQKPAA